jgi:hypothetical protein
MFDKTYRPNDRGLSGLRPIVALGQMTERSYKVTIQELIPTEPKCQRISRFARKNSMGLPKRQVQRG